MTISTDHKVDMYNDIHRTLISSFIATILENGGKSISKTWKSDILNDIVALSIYYTILKRVKSFGSMNPLTEDIVKSGTLVFTTNMLNELKGSKVNYGNTAKMLIGIIFYHLVIRKPLLNLVSSKTNLSSEAINAIEDSIETAILLSLDGNGASIPYQLIGLLSYYYLIRMN